MHPQTVKFPSFKKPFNCQLVTLGEQWTVSYGEQQVTEEGEKEGRNKSGWGVSQIEEGKVEQCIWVPMLRAELLLTAVKSAGEEGRRNMGRRRWGGGVGEAHWDT